jgi:hypothetical protein
MKSEVGGLMGSDFEPGSDRYFQTSDLSLQTSDLVS